MNGVLTPLSYKFSLALRSTDTAQGDLKFSPLLLALSFPTIYVVRVGAKSDVSICIGYCYKFHFYKVSAFLLHSKPESHKALFYFENSASLIALLVSSYFVSVDYFLYLQFLINPFNFIFCLSG
jgi:hypothetical protein